MTYTTEQAVRMAREVGGRETRFNPLFFSFSEAQLTALCNKVREQTLLEAAEMFSNAQMDDAASMLVAYRMAGVE